MPELELDPAYADEEHKRAYPVFIQLPSGNFFSWTTKAAGFSDPQDAETFKEEFPDWSM